MPGKKSSTAAGKGTAHGDTFRGGYAAGKATGGLKPPPSSVTKVKSSSK